MDYGRAFAAGVAGGVVMSVCLIVARLMGLPAILELWLGTMLFEASTTAWVIGFLMHLVISGLIGMIYGWGFERLTHRAGWTIGLVFAVVHLFIGGIAMAALPSLHPRVPEFLPAPGAFMSNLGAMGAIGFVALHLVYGAIVGALCAPVRRVTNA